MTTIKSTDLRFVMDSENKFDLGLSSVEVSARVVYINAEGRIRNPDEYDLPGHQDLAVSTLTSLDMGWYGFDVRYERPFSVDLHRAEAMVKVLRKINRKMDKLAEQFGEPEDFPAFLGRVAASLGMPSKPFLVKEADRGSSYDVNEYRSINVDGLRHWVGEVEKEANKEFASRAAR